jgi:hypothetical protein
MTLPDHRILDLTNFERPDDRPSKSDHSDLHMLRLALDLQLDAMMLTLGSAAQAENRGELRDDGVPWQRWLVEDLELARALAGALLEGDAAPVPGLGVGFASSSVSSALDKLAARYESMENLLSGVLDAPSRNQAWRPAASEALHRCRARLDELHRHRRDVIASSATRTTFLPGELLG